RSPDTLAEGPGPGHAVFAPVQPELGAGMEQERAVTIRLRRQPFAQAFLDVVPEPRAPRAGHSTNDGDDQSAATRSKHRRLSPRSERVAWLFRRGARFTRPVELERLDR